MATIYLKKTLGGFVPNDEEGREIAKGIKLDEVIKCEFTRPRNLRFHNLFFGLLGLVYENTDGQFKSVDHLLTVVKVGIGHCFWTILKDGTQIPHTLSISFARMDEDLFRAFFNKAVDYIIAAILPVGKAQLESEVFSMLGFDLSNLR